MSFVNHENTNAVQKAKHYIQALNNQLEICDYSVDMINKLCEPFPRRIP